jgi:N4-gp56 family major capsid protein
MDKSAMIQGKAGSQLQVIKETKFSVAGLTEGTETPVSALDFDPVVLTISWYGDAKQMTKEVIAYAFPFLMDDLKYGASRALAENRDVQILTELANTSTSAVYPISSGTTRYTSSTIVAGGVFAKEMVNEAKRVLRLANRELRFIVIHPNQEKALLDDDSFIDASKYGSTMPIMNGEIGMIYGARIISHASVQTATENSTTVYLGYGLAERAFMFAQKISPVFEFDEELKRERAVTFHYYEAFGVKILNSDAIVPLKSA